MKTIRRKDTAVETEKTSSRQIRSQEKLKLITTAQKGPPQNRTTSKDEQIRPVKPGTRVTKTERGQRPASRRKKPIDHRPRYIYSFRKRGQCWTTAG